MSSPIPPVSIAGGCSVVVDETLYVYSPDAFQALPLRNGGNWTQLPNGVSVSGAACVKVVVNDTSSGETLWIVGGAINASNPDYPGLQRYLFANKSWETITPVVKVTQNRQYHAATFLNTSASILLYAGSQTGNATPSTETFLISTNPPYSVRAYTSKNYPALSPLLLPWSENSAITLGGDEGVNSIYHFDPSNGWQDLGTRLTFDLNSTTTEQGLLVQGSDSSKVLELYDMSASPNVVSRVVLQDANGNIAPPGQTIGARSSRKRKRQTLGDWPPYNATYAPTITRAGYSLAQAPNGLVAITGGDVQYPVELFNQETNAWLNTTSFFGSSASTTNTSPSSSSSAASSPTSSSSAAPAASSHPRTSLILGATLGSILGFIALLIILLLCVRWRRRRRRTSRESSGSDEKGRLSFADRGLEGESVNVLSDPRRPANTLAFGDEANRRRSRTLTSQSSSAPLVPSGRATPGARQAAQMSPVKEKASPSKRNANRPFARGERGVPSVIIETDSNRNSDNSAINNHRGSGWSGYFFGKEDRSSNNRASSMTPRNSTFEPGATSLKPGTYLNYDPMKPGGSSGHDCRMHGPTEIPPLALGQEWDSGRVSKVITGASTSNKNPPLPPDPPTRAPSSRSAGVRTASSARPSTDAASTLSDAVFTSPEEPNPWTPVTKSDWTTPGKVRDTKTSSFYEGTSSMGDAMLMSEPGSAPKAATQSPGFGLRKSDGSLWGEPGPIFDDDNDDGMQPAASTPTPVSRIGLAKTTAGNEAVARSVSLKRPEKSAGSSDMSWLKIGES